jgi:phosphinothricin acetyltransferase
MNKTVIRRVEETDLPDLLAIYNHYILHTPASFNVEPLSLSDRKAWFDTFAPSGRYQCFVAAHDGKAIGWASSGRFRPKAAYNTSVETSVYLAPGEVGQGLGKRLYQTLLIALSREDIHRAYGLVTMPNDASVALHMTVGFRHICTLGEVGRKFGRFWDVAWFERAISSQTSEETTLFQP